MSSPDMQDEELLRYSRQIMLPDVDIAGQEALRAAHVLILGVGGLGSPAALYLAAAGIGRLTLVDHDTVDLSNLQRQVVHDTNSVGQTKVESAQARLQAINPHCQIDVVDRKLDAQALHQLLAHVDLALDCTDNFSSRFLLNDLCWDTGTPLVSGAAIGWEGQITVFDPNREDSPCYRCLYPSGDDAALNCAENGVIAPLVGIIGTSQAMEALKLIVGVGSPAVGRVMCYDAKYMEWRSLILKPRAECRCR